MIHLLVVIWVIGVGSASAATLCDDFDAPESTRVYFVSGMFTSDIKRAQARNMLASSVGDPANNKYRAVVNRNELPQEQLYQVVRQRLGAIDLNEFWKWFHNPAASGVPIAYKEALAAVILDAADSEFNTDPDLQTHVSRYLQDLNAGKKVVLVAHSQGNFYANNSYYYIQSRYPELSDSMGIVAVATPAPVVADGGLYTQNRLDHVIFGIVSNPLTPFNVVPHNVSITGDDIPMNHGFAETYMLRESAKIVGDIRATISNLVQPELNPDCDNRVAAITTLNAKDVLDISATLEGRLTDGENVDAWIVHDRNASNVICDPNLHNGTGAYTAETTISSAVSKLVPNTTYYARACAKGAKGGVKDGGLVQFITSRTSAKVTSTGTNFVGTSTATLRGTLTSGIGVDVWFQWGTSNVSLACDGTNYDGVGNYTAQTNVSLGLSNLQEGTQYSYLVCAKGGDGQTNSSAVSSFTTATPPPPPEISCSNQAYQGGTSGLVVIFDFSTKKGVSAVEFQTFTIPDKFEIFKSGTNIPVLTTPGFVSGHSVGNFTVDSSFDKVDVVVTGNTIESTEWELIVRCPP